MVGQWTDEDRLQAPDEVLVEAVMTSPAIAIPAELAIEEAAWIAAHRGIRHLLVVDEGGEPIGVVSACDLRAVAGRSPIGACLGPDLVTIEPGATVATAADVMAERGIGCLPVLDGRAVVGIVTRRDLRRGGWRAAGEERQCACCGTRHDLQPLGAASFCADCLDHAILPGVDEELGGGD